jgi:ribosomal protein S18 acetylase RimI-like enzyme
MTPSTAAGFVTKHSAPSTVHGFPPDFPSREIATRLVRMLLEHPGFYGVVAERDGRIVGSNFLDERCTIAGVGPITVDPAAQNQGVGRRLMQDVIDRAAARPTSSSTIGRSLMIRAGGPSEFCSCYVRPPTSSPEDRS